MSAGLRRAFTLIEVALSMSLVAVAVLSLFLVIPQGFKAQQAVRYQVLAAAKAMELIDLLHANAPGVMHNARDLDKEGVYPWDGRATYASMAPDLESALESMVSVVKPLPEGIADRFDSDGDEIGELLAAGGRLYYFYPSDPSGMMMVDPDLQGDRHWFDATNRLVVGVVGNAQQNSILHYPALKSGPYQAFYPSPPTHSPDWIATNVRSPGSHHGTSTPLFCRDVTFDRRIGRVWMDEETYGWNEVGGTAREGHYGAAEFLTYVDMPADSVAISLTETDDERRERRARAVGYLVPCLWFAETLGLDPLGAVELASPPNAPGDTEGDFDPSTSFDTWVENHSGPGDGSAVLAMRYLAHAAMCLVACHRDPTELVTGGGFELGGGVAGSDFPDLMTLSYQGKDWAPIKLELARIRAWHEASVRMAVRFADRAGPYNWGAPRPLNRQVMMDHPLVQLDLWSPPVRDDFPWFMGSGSIWDFPTGRTYDPSAEYPPQVVRIGGVPTEPRRQWRAVYGGTIEHPGRPFMYPGRVLDTDGDGDLDRDDEPIPDYVDGISDSDQAALGNPRHFNLSCGFEAAERTRELVFWSVDWQSYEDFESHPSAAIDATRYPMAAPNPWDDALRDTAAGRAAYAAVADGWLPDAAATDPDGNRYGDLYAHLSTMPADHPWNRRSSNLRQLTAYGRASVMALSLRNPEHMAVFELPSRRWDPIAGSFTGAFYEEDRPMISEINDFGAGNESRFHGSGVGTHQSVDITSHQNPASNSAAIADLLQHPQAYRWWNKFMNLGIYGANRNGVVVRRRLDLRAELGNSLIGRSVYKDTGNVDRGAMPPSVRIHAETVARFVFYDPRISGGHFQ